MKLILPVVCAVLASCIDSAPVTQKPDPWARSKKSISVISDPPGARIELNGNYIGTAPCSLDVEVFGKDDSLWKNHHFVALPVIGGQQVQQKFFTHMSDAPDRIFFDMNLRRAPRQIDLNITNP